MNTDNIWTQTTQDSVPKATAGTGTITSVNNKQKIIGVGTSFLTEAQIGDYIYIKGQNEFAKIVSIESDTELSLFRKFTVDLAASAFHITPRSGYHEVSVLVTGAADAEIDGVAFSQDETYNAYKDNIGSFGGNKYTAPIDVDATGTTVKIAVQF